MATKRTRDGSSDLQHFRRINFESSTPSSNDSGPNIMWIARSSGSGGVNFDRVIGCLLQRCSTTPKRGNSAQRGSGDLGVARDPGGVEGPLLRPLSERWMTIELLVYTRWVWSDGYERDLTDEDAVEILVNVREYSVVMLKAQSLMEESS